MKKEYASLLARPATLSRMSLRLCFALWKSRTRARKVLSDFRSDVTILKARLNTHSAVCPALSIAWQRCRLTRRNSSAARRRAKPNEQAGQILEIEPAGNVSAVVPPLRIGSRSAYVELEVVANGQA